MNRKSAPLKGNSAERKFKMLTTAESSHHNVRKLVTVNSCSKIQTHKVHRKRKPNQRWHAAYWTRITLAISTGDSSNERQTKELRHNSANIREPLIPVSLIQLPFQ